MYVCICVCIYLFIISIKIGINFFCHQFNSVCRKRTCLKYETKLSEFKKICFLHLSTRKNTTLKFCT